MSNFPYNFEESPKPKGKCPKCQQVNQFRYYKDINGQRLSLEFGKCERINSCGYHNPPSFKDAFPTNKIVLQDTDNQKLILPDNQWKEKFKDWLQDSSSNFHQYCLKTGIDLTHLQKHGVGTDKIGKTVFLYRDQSQKILNAKWVTYNDNGHRNKVNKGSYSMVQPKDGKSKYGMCLYGEDLLDPEKEKIVVIVESEKTKVIASFHYPMFDWLACSSNNGLTDNKIHVLFGRKVIWLCDADKAGRDNSSIKKLKSYGINYDINDLFPERTDGYDIADAIEEGLKPEIAFRPEIQKVENSSKKLDEYILSTQTVQYRLNNSIWIKTRNNWEIIADNFHIFIKYQTRDENEQYTWILEVKIAHREPIYMEISHEDFCSAKKLKTAFASKRLSFKANDNHVSELHSLLFTKTSFGDATKITRFGFHKASKTYFFSNVALTNDGTLLKPDQFNIIQNNDTWLSMPLSSQKLQKPFQLTENNISFNQWFEVYHKAHTIDKAFIPVCFYIMSLFRDIVVTHKGSSPILFLKGSAGTGKSSIVRNLTCLFGFQQEDINLKSKNTESAIVKLMSQSANSITWMDEYFNEFPHEGLLQAAYDNAGYHKSPDNSRGNNETDSVEIHSALALTSNYIPANPVFFSRCLLVQVENKEKTSVQRVSYEQLKEIESLGLAGISVELLRHRNLIDKHYPIAFKKLLNKVKDAFMNESIPERLFSNMVQTMTCAFILQCHGKIAICESTDENDILDDFGKVAIEYIRKQHEIQDETSVLTEFFSIIQMLYESFQIHEGVHFRFEGDLLFLRMPSIYPIFKQRYRTVYYKESPDRDSIVQELIKLEAPREEKEIKKTIRFRDDIDITQNTMNSPVTNSLSIKYITYSNKFSLDLSNRLTKI